jgi:hypothetical protein
MRFSNSNVIFITICIANRLSKGYSLLFLKNVRHEKPLLQASTDETNIGFSSAHVERRSFISVVTATIGSSLSQWILPQVALGAPPMTLGEVDGLKARLDRSLRAKPPKVLRSNMNLDFAVLLMRSSYNALDLIDCVAMDQFQRDFFLLRQAEYQNYVEQLGPGIVQQGILTDPYYFDFISFAQYATISREINNMPETIFEEQQPQESADGEQQKFVTRVIRRDPTISNNELASRHSRLVGKAVIDRLNEIFGNTTSDIPPIPTSLLDQQAILSSLTQLMKLFLLNGFAFDGNVAVVNQDSSGTEFCITLRNPANLWSGKALKQRGANPCNCFLLIAALELVSRSKLRVVSSSVKYDSNTEKSYLKIC